MSCSLKAWRPESHQWLIAQKTHDFLDAGEQMYSPICRSTRTVNLLQKDPRLVFMLCMMANWGFPYRRSQGVAVNLPPRMLRLRLVCASALSLVLLFWCPRHPGLLHSLIMDVWCLPWVAFVLQPASEMGTSLFSRLFLSDLQSPRAQFLCQIGLKLANGFKLATGGHTVKYTHAVIFFRKQS